VLLACGLGYAYQGPPLRLGYYGLGELLCFLSFGPLAVLAAHYSQSQSWSLPALAASLVVGMVTSLILFCSHFHQVEDDLAAGKRSPVARLGTRRSARLIPWICGSIFGLLLLFVRLGRCWVLPGSPLRCGYPACWGPITTSRSGSAILSSSPSASTFGWGCFWGWALSSAVWDKPEP
jgi:1,4-dihydroxy-2-naphthoate octaprenyltransferase